MPITEAHLRALARMYKENSIKYNWDLSEGIKALPAYKPGDVPMASFPPSPTINPTGLLTPTDEYEKPANPWLRPDEVVWYPGEQGGEETGYEEMVYELPARPPWEPDPEPWKRPSFCDREYTDWLLCRGNIPADTIRDMSSAEETQPVTGGMACDMERRRLRRGNDRKPYLFALDSKGRIAVTRLGEDVKVRCEW